MKRINFLCPECGGTLIVVVEELIERSSITGLETFEGHEILERGNVEDSEVTAVLHYECDSCHDVVGSTMVEAIDYLRELGMIEEEENA